MILRRLDLVGWIAGAGRRLVPVLLLALMPADDSVRAEIDLVAAGVSTAEECAALIEQNPRERDAYRCFVFIAQRYQAWDAATVALEGLLRQDPDDAWANLMLGRLEADRYRDRAVALLDEAVRGFVEQGEVIGEVDARLTLARTYQSRASPDDADRELSLAEQAAARADQPDPLVLAHLTRAWVMYDRGDYSASAAASSSITDAQLESISLQLKANVLSHRGSVQWVTNRLEAAREEFEGAAAILVEVGDGFAAATELSNIAFLVTQIFSRMGIGTRADVDRWIQEALESAVASGNTAAEASVRMMLSRAPSLGPQEQIEQIERALELYLELPNRLKAAFALRSLAWQRSNQEGAAAFDETMEMLDDALELAQSQGSLFDVARTHVLRASLLKSGGTREQIIAAHAAAVEAIERMRDLQRDGVVRARFIDHWDYAYHRMAGKLLEPVDQQPSPEDADLAFRTVERLRARVLLDAMDVAGATAESAGAGDDQVRREAILVEIGQIRRQLRTPGSESRLDELLQALRGLETEQEMLMDRIVASNATYSRMRRPRIPTLDALRQALAPGQAGSGGR